MARVFISHAGSDLRLATVVHRLLSDAGHKVFLDVDQFDGIQIGERWRQGLYAHLRAADVVVCLVSRAYVASSWCTIELATAEALGARLLPLTIESGVTHPLVDDIQHLDYLGDPAAALTTLEASVRGPSVGYRGWTDNANPFPGLRRFEASWQRVFFGRDRDRQQLASILRSNAADAVVTVVGPSGCGKSSLVRAGLMPAIAAEAEWWVLPAVVPGADPIGALASELAAEGVRLGLDWTKDAVRRRIVAPSGLADVAEEILVRASLPSRRGRLLLVIDQFEEVLTISGAAQREQLADVLAPVLGSPAAVVVTIRSEYLGQMLEDESLQGLRILPFAVRPLRLAELTMVIVEPARVAGIGISESLVRRLVDDTAGVDGLPLLAFTLQQLAEGVTRRQELSQRRYEDLGGVTGTLIRQADDALAAAVRASGRDADSVVRGLLRLVTVDDGGRPIRLRMPISELSPAGRLEVARFVERRLVATDASGGQAIVDVAHEAFLTAWPPLASAVTQHATALRTRRRIENTAHEWHAAGRPKAQLLHADAFAATRENLGIRAGHLGQRADGSIDLTANAQQFLSESERRVRQRRLRVPVIAVLVAVLTVIVAVRVTATIDAQRRAADAARDLALRACWSRRPTTCARPSPVCPSSSGWSPTGSMPTPARPRFFAPSNRLRVYCVRRARPLISCRLPTARRWRTQPATPWSSTTSSATSDRSSPTSPDSPTVRSRSRAPAVSSSLCCIRRGGTGAGRSDLARTDGQLRAGTSTTLRVPGTTYTPSR